MLRSDYSYVFSQSFSFLRPDVDRVFTNHYELSYEEKDGFIPSFVISDDPESWMDWEAIGDLSGHIKADSYQFVSSEAVPADHSFVFPQVMEKFSGLSFYLFIDHSELPGTLSVFLEQDPDNFYHADLNQPFEAGQWNFVNMSWGDFEKYGEPSMSQIHKLRMELRSLPRQEVELFVDEIRIVPDNSYIYDWFVLNDSLLQLFSLPDESLALSVQNYRERVFYPRLAKSFLNGSVLAKVHFLEKGKRCGVLIRGQGDHGFWFLMDGGSEMRWELLGGRDQKEFLSGGRIEGMLDLEGAYWLKLVADEKSVSVYAGSEKGGLTFITSVSDDDPKVGRAGIVALDRARCVYSNLFINYDSKN